MDNFFDASFVLHFAKEKLPELKKGQPAIFLENKDKASLFEEGTQFLCEHFVQAAATPSPHTWERAAYCLTGWLQFCQAIELHWKDASLDDRRAFRDAFLGAISPNTGRPYGEKGVKAAMVVVRAFYAFCGSRRWYGGNIGRRELAEQEKEEPPAFFESLYSARSHRKGRHRDRDLPKAHLTQVVRALVPDDLRALLNEVGPRSSDPQGDGRFARDRLIVDIGWTTGMRLAELVSLSTLQFLRLNPNESAPNSNLSLVIQGKGRKTRQVAIPTWVVLDAIAYIEGERKLALARGKHKAKREPIQLFLGHSSHSHGRGKPITASAVQKMFERACFSASLTDVRQRTNPENGEVFAVSTSRYSPHDLRHTYAVLTYHVERSLGNPEPWKKIQAQLGHAHLQTTIDTYLAHVEIFNDMPGLLNVRKTLGI